MPLRRASRLLLFSWLVLVCLPGGAVARAADWELRSEKQGVRIWTRPVEGSAIAAFRGETPIAAPVDRLLAVLRNAAGFVDWFPNTPEARTLVREERPKGGALEHRYMVMSMPWPVSTRDAIYRIETRRSADGGATLRMRAVPEYTPEREGHVRVPRAEGQWTLTPQGDATLVRFEMHLEPGGSLPAWLVNRRVVETPQKALAGLRETAGATASAESPGRASGDPGVW